MRAAAVLEDGDLVIGGPGEAAAGKIVVIGENVVLADHARLHRDHDLPDMADGRVPRIDEQPPAPQDLVIGLAHVGAVGADQIEVLTGPEPFAADDRRRRHRGAGDDIGRVHRLARSSTTWCRETTRQGASRDPCDRFQIRNRASGKAAP
jgi:hypothetical protein